MSSAVFFHNFNEVNLKFWAVACLATASIAGASLWHSQHPDAERILGSLLTEGTQAENNGQYREARVDFDLALLQARTSGDQKVLINALIDSARIDREFEENKTAVSLAREAVELSRKFYGETHMQTAIAMSTLADVLDENDESLSLYKKALTIYKLRQGNINTFVAKTLLEMSFCYESKGDTAAAMSCVKASIRDYQSTLNVDNADYPKAMLQYVHLFDLDPETKTNWLRIALSIQEEFLGPTHPAIASTLKISAADQTKYEAKHELLERALHIDETAFGDVSLQVARDLMALADADESAGKSKEAHDYRKRAATIYELKKASPLEAMSDDFLESYSKLLKDLKFDKYAARIDAVLQKKQTPAKPANASTVESSDSENDPEYWQRTELVPIENVQDFDTANFDHIQVWYDKGALKIDGFREGEKIWTNTFGQCPTGILNIKVSFNELWVTWRDGDGPIWHTDRYRIEKQSIYLLDSTTSDAYAQQIETQVDQVVSGDTDAVNDGSVESVPASYINNNFIADAIRKGEHKALQLYGDGDAADAAQRLGLTFDLTAKAINNKRNDDDKSLSRFESWVDAWKYQQLPLTDYITALNDYGFFLQQSGCLQDSAKVLALVTKVAPGRALGYLNLGDSYWKLGNRSSAQSCYQTYLGLMKLEHEQNNIPPRVFQRVASPVASLKTTVKSPALRSNAFGV